MSREALLKQRIAEQGFTTRTYNCLRHTGIETVEDLATIAKWELFCTNGLGRKTMEEIEEFLSERGLRLGMKRKELYPGGNTPEAKVAEWMIEHGYATGHGDTVEDLLKELEWQIREREREECAKIADKRNRQENSVADRIAKKIRARDEQKEIKWEIEP